MNAQEARAMALKINTDANSSQYAEIKKLIKRAVELGNYETFVYEYIKKDVTDKLESEGYIIGKTDSFRNETTTKISW